MGAFIDLTNRKINRILVVSKSSRKTRKGCFYWVCKCDCGNTFEMDGDNLRRGTIKSCGCYRIERCKRGKIDKTGNRYGKLIVLSRHEKTKWLCQCECGNTSIVDGGDLVKGTITSCGCLGRLRASKRLAQLNNKKIGPLNPAYNSNLTDEERWLRQERRDYQLPGYKDWRFKVMENNNFRCLVCKTRSKKGERLVAHHLEGFKNNPDLRLEISNGVCLCQVCHINFHKTFGYKNSTSQQFEEYLLNQGVVYD
jgi:hypothetical protein